MDDSLPASETCDPQHGSARGADRELETRARLDQIAARLTQIAGAFAQNVVAASADWMHHVADEAALTGMTDHGKLRARRNAEAQQLDGFLLTLDTRSYDAAFYHLDDRKLRRDLYEAHVTRASDQGPRKRRFDNTPLVQETLALRHELAVLRGYENYAEFALRDSVLTTSHEVERFLLTGGQQIRARAQAELDEIWTFAKAKGVPKGFATWDLGYGSGAAGVPPPKLLVHKLPRVRSSFRKADLTWRLLPSVPQVLCVKGAWASFTSARRACSWSGRRAVS